MIRGERIHLRTFRQSDLQPYLNASSDISTRGAYYPLNLPTETSIQQRFDKDGYWGEGTGMLLIFQSSEARMIGTVVFFKTAHYYEGFEIGYRIFDPADHGKGYASEAVKLFSKYLFDAKNILRLTIQVESGNKGSRRVAEKCGFQFEGVARSVFLSNGRPTDIEVWSLTHADVYPSA